MRSTFIAPNYSYSANHLYNTEAPLASNIEHPTILQSPIEPSQLYNADAISGSLKYLMTDFVIASPSFLRYDG